MRVFTLASNVKADGSTAFVWIPERALLGGAMFWLFGDFVANVTLDFQDTGANNYNPSSPAFSGAAQDVQFPTFTTPAYRPVGGCPGAARITVTGYTPSGDPDTRHIEAVILAND